MKKSGYNWKHFKDHEFTDSDNAVKYNINNEPTAAEWANINNLVVNILDPLREAFGQPITVTSGFRCEKLNRVTKGSSKTSDHRTGCAADITTGKRWLNGVLFEIIRKYYPYKQLICEHPDKDGNPSWVHVAFQDGNNRKDTLLIKKVLGKDRTYQWHPFPLNSAQKSKIAEMSKKIEEMSKKKSV